MAPRPGEWDAGDATEVRQIDLKETSLAGFPALVLAGGLGTRLQSVVPDRQKTVAPVGARPFITYVLDQLAAAGVRRAILCTGHLAGQVEECLGEKYGLLNLEYSRETSPLGTAGAVRLALPFLEAGAALVLNGDSHCAVDLVSFVAAHRQRRAAASLVLARMEDTSRFGRVELNATGEVEKFAEKNTPGEPGWVNAGIYLLERSVIESIPVDRVTSLEKDVFPSLIGRGLVGYPSDGQLWDIGVPDEYVRAQTEFQAN